MTMNVDKVIELLETYPLLDETTNYGYGTAGFRFKVEHMDGILLRVGIASAYLLQDEDMGVMVTASHNDETYNGVKLSSPDGSMIPSDLERILVGLVNERNLDAWRQQLQQQFEQPFSSASATFHVGYDTRSHSERLTDLFVQGASAMGVTVTNHNVLTTPMLHHIVLHSNPKYLPSSIPPCPSREGYTKAMAKAYLELIQEVATTTSATTTTTSETLLVDCACGVGYKAVQEVVALLDEKNCSIIPLNQPGEGPLNINCGSEHVQKELQPPTWYKQQKQQQQQQQATTPPASQNYCCSVDGDADRIVFFSATAADGGTDLTLLDGDKIAVLIGQFIKEQLHKAYAQNQQLPRVTVGVVQTAYANGASTNYLQVG
jgi:phosphoacetylglucosamine mutase